MKGSLLIHIEKLVPEHYVGYGRNIEELAHRHLIGKVPGMTADAYRLGQPMMARLIEDVNIGPLLAVTTAGVFCRHCSGTFDPKDQLHIAEQRASVHYDPCFCTTDFDFAA